MKYTNKVATLLVIVAVIFALIAFVSGLMMGTENFGGRSYFHWSIIGSIWFSGFVSALILIALAEIIQLLSQMDDRGRRQEAEDLKGDDASLRNKNGETEDIHGSDDAGEEKRQPTAKDYQTEWFIVTTIIILIIFFIFTFQGN